MHFMFELLTNGMRTFLEVVGVTIEYRLGTNGKVCHHS